MGTGLSDLQPEAEGARDFFASAETRARKAEHAVDTLRLRFGEDAVRRARTLR